MELKQAQRTLTILFWEFIALSVIIVIIFETDWLTDAFAWEEDSKISFALQAIDELVTIVCIPVSLWLFKWKTIANKLKGDPDALCLWGEIRMWLLCIPLLCNLALYEDTRIPSFGYLTIIILLCLFFIYPSKNRCRADIGLEETNDKK